MSDYVFICYSRRDEDFALKLAEKLKSEGTPVWIDQWDIPSGTNWNRTIEKALKECTHLLVILSPSSVESDEVQSEWLSALDDGKVVVPALYQPCQIPFRLKSIQYIDFTSRSPDDKEAIEQIRKSLGIAGSPPAETKTESKKAPSQLLSGPILNLKNNSKLILIATTIFLSILVYIYFSNYYILNIEPTPLGTNNHSDSIVDIDVNVDVFEAASDINHNFRIDQPSQSAKYAIYRIMVINNGDLPLEDVILSADMAKGIDFENTSYLDLTRGEIEVKVDPVKFDEYKTTNVKWNLRSLAPAEIKTIIMRAYSKPEVLTTKVAVSVTGEATDGTSVTDSQNTAYIIRCTWMNENYGPCDNWSIGTGECKEFCPDWIYSIISGGD